MLSKYPVGGPRESVYNLMRSLGFSMSNWSDKEWTSADKITVHIFGTGSMARIHLDGDFKSECKLDDLATALDDLRKG